ncbi:hypothetical protein IMZ48_10650 [Candidatus Bathyarchaeota archaeon]|nr:hypothetical protein [Candidatus Bathyarchaeota archaeon]
MPPPAIDISGEHRSSSCNTAGGKSHQTWGAQKLAPDGANKSFSQMAVCEGKTAGGRKRKGKGAGDVVDCRVLDTEKRG